MIFESVTCSRCGGSGQYSYCSMYGRTCFKCAGRGKTLTKRGAAANRWLKELRTRKAEEVPFGAWVRLDGVPGFSKTQVFKVETISTRLNAGKSLKDGVWVSYNSLVLEGKSPKGEALGLETSPTGDVYLVPTKAEAKEQVAAALAYQATLTKSGTVRKGK